MQANINERKYFFGLYLFDKDLQHSVQLQLILSFVFVFVRFISMWVKLPNFLKDHEQKVTFSLRIQHRCNTFDSLLISFLDLPK